MRLINVRTYGLEEFYDNAIPPYAILSHTWEDEEVLIHDMRDLEIAMLKKGFKKIKYACEQAYADHLRYVWVDTCCIDKTSSAELQEAINSMFRWYSLAQICYAYLEDVMSSCLQLSASDTLQRGPGRMSIGSGRGDYEEFEFWRNAMTGSRWFTRGWTLQELIAPSNVAFFGCDWNFIGTRDAAGVVVHLSKATKINLRVLNHSMPISSVSVAQKMAWAADRKTSRIEDQAYSLLGLFNVNMPMLYGEGKQAFVRLQEEIIKTSSDHSILAWDIAGNREGALLAQSPADFAKSVNVVSWGAPAPLELTTRGLRASLPVLKRDDTEAESLVILNCRMEQDLFSSLALRVRGYASLNAYHVQELNSDGEKPTRLTLVDAKRVDGAPSSAIEITRRPETETGAVMKTKVCICVADGSHPAEITHTELRSGIKIAHDPKSVIIAPDCTRDGKHGVLVKFASGEQVVVLLILDVLPVVSFGIHAWLLNWKGRSLDLSSLISQWNRPEGSSLYSHNALLFNVQGKRVTASVTDRVILGERVIMASVSMNDNDNPRP